MNPFIVMIARLIMKINFRYHWLFKSPKGVVRKKISIPTRSGEIKAYTYDARTPDYDAGSIIFIHGGGFIIGDCFDYDPFCRSLSKASNLPIIFIEYRLAPENRFPAAPHDCIDAVNWILANGESIGLGKSKFIIAGDSAGGNLTAVVSQQTKIDYREKIAGQVVLYPTIGHYTTPHPSHSENAESDPCLSYKQLILCIDTYLGVDGKSSELNELINNPLFNPMLALNNDDNGTAPPALVITASGDLLRDEGKLFADALKAKNVDVQYSEYKGVGHGFMIDFGPTDRQQEAMNEMIPWINKKLG